MQAETIKRVKVWSAPVRLSHWLMAAAALVLLATGWLLRAGGTYAGSAADFHYVAGYVLIAALVLRVYLLLLGVGAANWRDCLPPKGQWRAVAATVRCYVSLGRFPLPSWYAHNPLWGPIYLVLFAVLGLQGVTGLAFDAPYRLAGLSLSEAHAAVAPFIGGFVLLHVVAVFVHDLLGSGSDVSAMINGHRIFVLRGPDAIPPSVPDGGESAGTGEVAKVHVVRGGETGRQHATGPGGGPTDGESPQS